MRDLLDLLLPPRCAGCAEEGSVLCSRCTGPLWRRHAEPPGVPLGMPAALPHGLVQLEWCAAYSGPVRDALHAFKYDGERRLADPLADALAARWSRAGAGGDLLTWVPVHHTRLAERGFDQAQELAVALGSRLGLPVAACLERRQRTTAQHSLSQAARAGNTAGVFSVPEAQQEAVRGRWIVVVDDIATTGATLAGCATALLGADAMAVSAACIARDR